MDWWLASFFLGAILSLFLPIVPDLFALFLLLLLSISFFYYRLHATKPLRASAGLLLGAIWMLFNGYSFQHLWQDNNINAIALSTKAHWVQGQVLSLQLPQQPITLANTHKAITSKKIADKRLRFNFRVTHINQHPLNKAVDVRLSWKNATLFLQQGQIAYLKAKIKPAHGLANIGGFNYQTWLNSKSISATGYVHNHKNNKVVSPTNTYRQQHFNDYSSLLSQHGVAHPLTPLLLALGFGSRTALNQDLWQVLQATGTGHLIAISGLHIGLVATGSYVLFMLFVRLLPLSMFAKSGALQRFNVRYMAIALSLLVAVSYGYLAGFSLPTIRALVMVSLYWAMRLMAIKLSMMRWLLLTLCVLTLTTPFSLFTASFWLSVYAVIIIFVTLWRFKSVLASGPTFWRFLKGLVIIQLSLTLMLLPISAVFFQQISVVALLANIIAVPWMSFVSIPSCLLSVLLLPISDTLSQLLVEFCLVSLQWLWSYLVFLSEQSWAIIALSSGQIQLLVITGLLGGVWLFLQPRLHIISFCYKHNRLITLCCSAIVLLTTMGYSEKTDKVNLANTSDKNWQLIAFDVGQGLSVLIQKHNKAILYDTGAAYPSGFNMIDAVVLPYLQHAGIETLDKVIISHSDNDHAGGLNILQQSISINSLIYNNESVNDSAVMSVNACMQGKSFEWQGLTFTMLWPEKNVAKENDDSCVILISDGMHQVLLTGDISQQVEAKLLQLYPHLHADILLVPHHGSKTSSSDTFVAQIKPKIAIVSAGFLNRWQMPVTEVVERYKKHQVELVNSAVSGQLIVNFSQKGLALQSYHDDLWPFWFANTY